MNWNDQVGTIKNNGINSVEEIRELRRKLSEEGVDLEIEEGTFIASDKKTGVVSQGKTMEESLENLEEAIKLYKEEF